jgi:hypothetical protein
MKIFKKGRHNLITGTNTDVYETDTNLTILVGREGDDKVTRLHLSISHPQRYPSWDEIKEARNALLPSSKDFAMIFPREGDYVNIHAYCFHLWEIKGDELTQAIDRL